MKPKLLTPEELQHVAACQRFVDVGARLTDSGAKALLDIIARLSDTGTPAPIWRHNKRGTHYRLVGEAQVQAQDPLTDYEIVTVYRGIEDGELWVRRRAEFEERFTQSGAPRSTVT